MAYVEEGCDQCGLILPKVQMQDWTEQVEVSRTSASTGTYANGRTRYVAPRITYKTKHLRLCSDCYDARLEAELAEAARRERQRRAQRTRSLILGAIVLAGLLVLAVIMVSAGGSTTTVSPTADNRVSAPADENISETGASYSAAKATASANESKAAANNVAVATTEPEQIEQSGPSANLVTEVAPTPENTPALSMAVRHALETGVATPWSAEGKSGIVTVGEGRPWHGKPCRSFAFTVGRVESTATIACEGIDGIWRPESPGAE